MKKAIIDFTMFVLKAFVLVVCAYVLIKTGVVGTVVERTAEFVNEHVDVVDQFEGIEIGSNGVNGLYSRHLVFK